MSVHPVAEPAASAVAEPLASLGAGVAGSLLLVAAVTLALAAVHVVAPGLTFVESAPRTPMLSFGSGVSVAYVFGHLLPEVSHVGDARLPGDAALVPSELPVFLVALAGFVAFYGLEHFVQESRAGADARVARDGGEPNGAFWLHVGFFAGYNALVGYLVVDLASGHAVGLLLFGVAVGLHLFVNAHGLRDHHRELYHRYGRWLLAAAVVAGGAVGLTVDVPRVGVAAALSFLAGAIVLNVVKEELPSHRESRFSAFVAGVVLYTALLVTV